MVIKRDKKSGKAIMPDKGSGKWPGIVAGIVVFLLWFLPVHSIKFLSGPVISGILYLVFFSGLLIWSVIAKKTGGFLAFTAITLILKCYDLLKNHESITGVSLFFLALAVCLYGLSGVHFNFQAQKKKNRAKGRLFVKRRAIAILYGLLIVFMLAGVRESDMIVSKFYFTPWPIYPDYAYPADVEKVNFKSPDGTPLNGWYIPGKSPEAKNRPVLLYLHGNAGNMAAQYGQFQFLSEWGYDVFTFDYRGFGLSGGQANRRGLWADTKAAFQEMTVLQPGRKYGVVGFSMGTTYALLLAANEPQVSAAVFLSGFTSFRDIGVHNLGAWFGISPVAAKPIGKLLVPNGLDPVQSAAVSGLPPAFFAHGTADGTIPYAMGEKIAAIYKGNMKFLPMPQYNHGDYFLGPLAEEFHKELDDVFLRTELAMADKSF